MSYKVKGEQISRYSNETIKGDKNDIIYYNFSLNAGFRLANGVPDSTEKEATFNEINQNNVVENTSNYSLGILRCCIPTIGSIPRLIFPVQIGQIDYDKTYNKFTLIYYDATNAVKASVSRNVMFKSEIINPTPATTGPYSYPLAPISKQDVSGYYYFIYHVESVVKMFNDTLYAAYQDLVTACAALAPPIVLDPLLFPFITYTEETQLFSMCAPANTGVNNFRTDLLPGINIFMDDYTQTLLNLNCSYYTDNARPQPGAIWRVNVYNQYDNIVTYKNKDGTGTLINYYQMQADQSSIPAWQAFQSIVFVVNQGLSLSIQETDSIPVDFQQPTSSSFDKPNLPILCDFEIDQELWAKSTQYIQFQASSREQVRLISMGSNNPVKNMNLSVYWKSNFGSRYPVQLTASAPLTLKLGWFPKWH